MEALAASGEVGGARGAIFKQMAEMKKKIQLVEGERKAIFEDSEREKEENKERIKKLSDEIKQYKNEFQKAAKTGETILKKVEEKPHLDTLVLKTMSGEVAIQTLDFKVADLRKKLDKVKYENGRKTKRIEALMAQYDKVLLANNEMERMEDIMEESAEGQRLRFLENEIHKTNLKLMEGETIKKKYTSILDMLKKERLTFSNQLEALETTIKKQDDEIERLKNTQKAALSTRDLARTSQQKQEVSLLSEGKDRDKKLSEHRRLAEDRKNYFDTMERHMFSSKQSTKGTGRESIATSDPMRSGSVDEKGEDEEDGEDDDKENMYEEAFAKMKRAAGVSEVEEVVHRFETQEDTGKHLQELQNRAEKEIRDLGAVKEKLEAEWELVKFMGQEENTELREKLELLDEDITDQQIRKKNADEKLQLLNKLLVGIKSGLEIITQKLYAGDVIPVPATRNSMEQLSVAEEKLAKVMGRLLGVDVFTKKLEMDEERFVPEGLGYKTDLFEEEEKKKEDVESGPEEEEVPTRGYLKRQSNLILDAKSRSKRGGRKR